LAIAYELRAVLANISHKSIPKAKTRIQKYNLSGQTLINLVFGFGAPIVNIGKLAISFAREGTVLRAIRIVK